MNTALFIIEGRNVTPALLWVSLIFALILRHSFRLPLSETVKHVKNHCAADEVEQEAQIVDVIEYIDPISRGEISLISVAQERAKEIKHRARQKVQEHDKHDCNVCPEDVIVRYCTRHLAQVAEKLPQEDKCDAPADLDDEIDHAESQDDLILAVVFFFVLVRLERLFVDQVWSDVVDIDQKKVASNDGNLTPW